MKLRKDEWLEEYLGKITTKLTDGAHNVPKALESGLPMISARDIQDYKIDLSNPRFISKENFEKENKRTNVEANDILLTIVGTIGRCAIIPDNFKRFTLQRSVAVIRTNQYPQYILTYFDSPNYQNQLLKKAIGTAQKGVYLKSLAETKILLPPLEEQKQIAALFQSIETAMKQVDGQKKNLKTLWKKLIDGLANEQPAFGNLLQAKELKKVNYCDVTEKLMRKIDPLTYGIDRIVAGENLGSEDFKIRTWQKIGEGYLGPAFHVLFKAGDILYGSRRTYLKKVALADFDGVCSNTTYVIRAKEKILLQDFLKHIMLSERFTQFSIGVSKGSTNPYINWKDLDNFSFQIPDVSIQKEIVNVLDGILKNIEQLKQQKTSLKNLKQKLLSEILG